MQIRMTGDFSYDLVPGLSRRTLPKGLVLDEPIDVALAAIDAGKAERWPPQSVTGELALELDDEGDLGSEADGDGDGDDGTGSNPAVTELPPAPAVPKASPGTKKGATKAAPAGGEATPAEAVEPGGDDDNGDAEA